MNLLYWLGGILNDILKKLSAEDIVLLIIIFVFAFENKCDHNFTMILVIIFISGIEQGILLS